MNNLLKLLIVVLIIFLVVNIYNILWNNQTPDSLDIATIITTILLISADIFLYYEKKREFKKEKLEEKWNEIMNELNFTINVIEKSTWDKKVIRSNNIGKRDTDKCCEKMEIMM